MSFRKKLITSLFALSLFASPAMADFAAGKKAYDQKDWKGAILNLRPLVEKGDAPAAVLMGNMYLEGYGVDADAEEAFYLFRQAAVAGNADGMLALAALYQGGVGPATNIKYAIAWFERAARAGSQTGAFFYAAHLYQGNKSPDFDFKPDHEASYKWFRIAGRNGTSKELSDKSWQMADELAKKLTPDQIRSATDAADQFKAEDPKTFGDPPDADLFKPQTAGDKPAEAATEQKTEAPQSTDPADEHAGHNHPPVNPDDIKPKKPEEPAKPVEQKPVEQKPAPGAIPPAKN